MPLPLLEIFKFFLIALIWLFFLRVVRAVWVEVRIPKAVQAESSSEAIVANFPPPPVPIPKEAKLTGGIETYVLIATEGPHEGDSFEIKSHGTIGRGKECTVSLTNDSFISTVHARIFREGDQLFVEDLGSTNGTYVGSVRVEQPIRIGPGERIKVGQTLLEVSSK